MAKKRGLSYGSDRTVPPFICRIQQKKAAPQSRLPVASLSGFRNSITVFIIYHFFSVRNFFCVAKSAVFLIFFAVQKISRYMCRHTRKTGECRKKCMNRNTEFCVALYIRVLFLVYLLTNSI